LLDKYVLLDIISIHRQGGYAVAERGNVLLNRALQGLRAVPQGLRGIWQRIEQKPWAARGEFDGRKRWREWQGRWSVSPEHEAQPLPSDAAAKPRAR
jgi:hypothetical protein